MRSDLVRFFAVGASGVAVNLAVLTALLRLGAGPRLALAGAIAVSVLSNYLINNFWTFRPLARRGARALLIGAVAFCLTCAAGALINFAITTLALAAHLNVYAGDLVGIVGGSLSNYQLSRRFTWRRATAKMSHSSENSASSFCQSGLR
jgi:dolichol-phosphate mannosyltransferase